MNNLLLWTFITLNCILTIPGRHYYYLIFKWFCKSRCNKFRNFKKELEFENLKSPDPHSHRKLSRTFNEPNGLKCDEILYYYR